MAARRSIGDSWDTIEIPEEVNRMKGITQRGVSQRDVSQRNVTPR